MPLLQVFRDPGDTGDGALNKAQIDAALLLATEGIELEAGDWNARCLAGRFIGAGINKTIAGAPVVPGSAPVTRIFVKSTDGAGASVVAPAANGVCTGIVVRDLYIDGGRTIKTWGAETGACVAMSGQNAYGPGGSGLQLINVHAVNGVTQQVVCNSVKGFYLNGVKAWATANPAQSAHGCDFDAVANEKNSADGVIEYSDFDAFGQEALKFENASNITVRHSVIRMYCTLVQDQVDVYGSLGGIVFESCQIHAAINLGLLKRRRIPGSTYVNQFPAGKTCTLTGSNVIGGTVNSPGSAGGGGEHVFSAGDVGQMVGYYSGQGVGCAQITAVNGSGGITATVVDVFGVMTLASWNGAGSPRWVIAATDNGGSGAVTFTNNTFGPGGMVWAQSAGANCYGAQTFDNNVFSLDGNSWSYPAGVAVTQVGTNLNSGLPLKRFARPSNDARYGALLGGTGIAGVNQGAARGNATISINAAIGFAVAGEEVRMVDGTYLATGTTNRNINCGGKAIVVRADTPYGAVINGAAGGSAQCVASSADPTTAEICDIVAINWAGGSGAGFTVTGGSLRLRRTRAEDCTAANSGGGYRVSSGATPLIEDWEARRCRATAGGGGGAYNAAAAAVFRRGRIDDCDADANLGGGVRNAGAGAVFDQLHITNCIAGTAGGGFAASAACTLTGYVAYGNAATATGGNDLWIANGQTVTMARSALCSNDTSFFPVHNGTSGALVATDSTVRGGASQARLGNAAGANAWTNVVDITPLVGRTCRAGISLVPNACHVGNRGLGMLGADILAATSTGEHGAGLMVNDNLLADREYRLVVSGSTFASGALKVFEDGSIDFTGPGTATQTLYMGGVPAGTAGLDAGFDPPVVGAVPGMVLATTYAALAATYTAQGFSGVVPGMVLSTSYASLAAGYAPPVYGSAIAPMQLATAFGPLAGSYVPLGYAGVLPGMVMAMQFQAVNAGPFQEAWKNALKEYTLLAPVDQIDHLGGFAEKQPEARVTLAFEFKRFSPIPASCVVTLMQVRGPTDPQAQDVLEGQPAILGTKVYQRVKLGQPDCDYRLTCLLEDQSGSAFVLRGLLPVRSG